MELDSDPLNKVSDSSLADENNIAGRVDSTNGGKPGSPMEISHRQSRWLLHTNNTVTKKNVTTNSITSVH